MNAAVLREVTLWIGIGAGAIGSLVLVLFAWSPVAVELKRKWTAYEAWVTAMLRSVYSPMRPRAFAARHLLTIVVGGVLVGVSFRSPGEGLVAAGLGAYLPVAWLRYQQSKRKAALEAQLDATLQSLANTISVAQNLEDGFATIAERFEPPISQEADILVKQVRLGTPMDEALHDLGSRCRSRNVDAMVTALTIGRQTGGELPKVLERAAAVLRESMRVEGVMEGKTSEGKAQVVAMGVLPFAFGLVLQIVDPEWMRPLFTDPIGWMVLSIACVLEFVGVVIVHKVSRIDV